jgi:hypothetical protein
MAVWQRERILTLASDASSRVAGQQLSAAARWTALGVTDRCLWGRCQGSAGTPYETVVDLGVEPAFACSCPSRKSPCKHALGLLLLWSGGGVPTATTEADFALGRLRATGGKRRERAADVVDPEAAARRVAARAERVAAGLEDLDRWLRDQLHTGLSGLEQAGYAHFDQVAARMVDAQASGVAGMLRSIPAELGTDGWPGRVLERLAALHLLVEAHRRLDVLPPELAANIRSRVGYPVTKAQVLSSAGVRDRWEALGMVDTVEYQLQTRRVWLRGASTRRWALWLSFAAPGTELDTTVLPGQVLEGDLHFYPGSGFRAVVGDNVSTDEKAVGALPAEDLEEVRRRFAELLGADPWTARMPAVLAAAPMPPVAPRETWRLRDSSGRCVAMQGLDGEPWSLLARSGGEPISLFGEWYGNGFRPMTALPDDHGNRFDATLAA